MPASRARRRAVLLAACLLAGCGAVDLRTPTPPRTTYVLDAVPALPAALRRSPAVLLVDVPAAAPGYATPRIAYARAPQQLDYYNRSEWADTPARLLLPLVVRTLERQGAWAAVLAAPAPVRADQRLALELLEFVHHDLAPPGTVRVALRATLLDVESRAVRATRVIEAEEPVASDDAAGAAAAFNQATGRVLAELAAFTAERAPAPAAARRRASR